MSFGGDANANAGGAGASCPSSVHIAGLAEDVRRMTGKEIIGDGNEIAQ